MARNQVQAIIDQLIYSYLGLPEVELSRFYQKRPRLVVRPDVYSKLLNIKATHQEDI
jgi:hypothetical protein